VATPGSANAQAAGFFAAIVQACVAGDRRAILLSEFSDQIPDPLPEGIRWFRYLPLDRLLPRAAAFVHHGGIGSAAQGMAAGIPQLVMPLAHDQFDNAARLEHLGVGGWIPKARFTGARVAEALGRLVNDPEVARACAGVAERLRARNGLARAADAITARFP
jgi:UDP:flavonoid glycosyltransferase YjiC (YdhE family)